MARPLPMLTMTSGEVVAGLGGTGLLADDLYLLAHHDVTGKPFLQPRAVGIGLSGALLAELALSGRICVRLDAIGLLDSTPPDDRLSGYILGLILGERDRRPVRDWLTFLAGRAELDIARRLERSGYLVQVASRRPWQAARWVPVDPDCAFAPLVRVRAVLDPARPVTVAADALAGLAAACGLGSRLLPYGPPGARRCLDEAVRRLRPDLRELIAQTQETVDAALLSHRL